MTKILIQQIISLPFDKQQTYANVVNYDYKMWIISTYKIDICWLSSESSILLSMALTESPISLKYQGPDNLAVPWALH